LATISLLYINYTTEKLPSGNFFRIEKHPNAMIIKKNNEKSIFYNKNNENIYSRQVITSKIYYKII
jgi:hypothetical protein